MLFGNSVESRPVLVQLTLGSTDKTPVHIPLTELALEEAASHATRVFWDVRLLCHSFDGSLYSYRGLG